MLRTLLYLALIQLASGAQFHKSNLSCELSASTFPGLKCEHQEPYLVFGGTLTYLVRKGDQIMQLKVKRLVGAEMQMYQDKLEKKENEKIQGNLKEGNEKENQTHFKKEIKKEIVSSETENRLKEMEKKEISDNNKGIKINIDDSVGENQQDEIRHLKIKSILTPDDQKQNRLEKKVGDEPEQQKQTENTQIINQYTLVSIPKKEVVKLNEAKVLLKFKEKRGFQDLIDENIFAGHKLFLMNHPKNGTLKEFVMAQQSLPQEERFFDNELKKMKFFDSLVQTVVDLHEMGFVHSNLSITTVFVDQNFDPVIGGFDYVQDINSMAEMDADFFVSSGEVLLAKDLKSLDSKDFNFINNKEHSPVVVNKDIEIKSPNQISVKSNGIEDPTMNQNVEVDIKMEFRRSLEYAAPELILAGNERPVYFDSKIDTYSLGALYFYLLYGKPPFHGDNKAELLESLKDRMVNLKAGTSTNSVSLFMNSLNLDPNSRAPTYYLGLRLKRVLAMDFRHILNEDVKLSTDFDYTNRYGRDFFDKYSEMIFVLMMAFIVIPATVFLASYKFKSDARRQVNQERENEQRENQREEQRRAEQDEIRRQVAIMDRHVAPA